MLEFSTFKCDSFVG